MTIYNTISANSLNFNSYMKLYEQAFPADERRETADLIRVIKNCREFKIIEAVDGNTFLGFFTYWDFSDCGFAYGEHFAIEPEARNGGIGARFLLHIISSLDVPLIIEVELEDNAMACRRVKFYERMGLKAWRNVGYTQPPYSPGKTPVPMMLMTTDGFSSEAQVQEAARVLHRRIYGIAD